MHMRRVLACAFVVLALTMLVPVASPVHAAVSSPLAVRVSAAGIVSISDAQLIAAGWSQPIPRERVTLTQRGQVLPLADTGSGFAFIGLVNESRWSRESVYWLSIGDVTAPRAALANRVPTPLAWDADLLYERHQLTARSDAWWAGELRGSQTVSATLTLPDAIPAGTTLQLRLRATQVRGHAVSVLVDGQSVGAVSWADAPTGAQVVTRTVSLPAHAAGPLRVDLALASSSDTILVDDFTLPGVYPPATPIIPQLLTQATAIPNDLAGADLLIITHSAFRSALDPLIAAHAKRGQRAAVVDVQAAYDAFSGGERDPEAIRQLIRQVRPHAVLLVGAGTVALRQDAPTRPTFIPPYLIYDIQDGETSCDTCYTRLNNGPPTAQVIPDIPIGRFPVATLAEVQTMVAKTVSNLTAPPLGAWQSRALVLADNDFQADGTPDPAGDFTETAETGLSALPKGLNLTRLYYAPNLSAPNGSFEPDTARLRCRMFRLLDGGRPSDQACSQVDATQSGVALWIYVGHGSPWQWAVTQPTDPTPYLWYLYDADNRRNGDRLPILFSMTCLSGDFANPILQSNDERLVLKSGGGVVASIASAGEGVNTGHARMLRGALAQLYAPMGNRTLGAAHLAGLRALQGATPDLAFSFSILGDPLVVAPFVPVASVHIPMVVR